VDDRHFTEGTDQEEIGESFPGQRLTHHHILDGFAYFSLFGPVVHRRSVCIDRPQRRRHVAKLLIRSVHRELEVRAGTHIVITGEALTDTVETPDHVIPRGVVQVIDTLDALLVGLIEVVAVVGILGRTVQETFARRECKHGQDDTKDKIQILFHIHILHL